MKKIIMSLFVLLAFDTFCVAAGSAPVSIFSTSTDWSAVTGLPLYQYTGNLYGNNKDLVKKGVVLYYLDSFPCYGQTDSVRVWISQKGKIEGNLRLVCVHSPETIQFAYFNVDEKEKNKDRKTTGMLICPVDKDTNFSIDISKCSRGKDWEEYK